MAMLSDDLNTEVGALIRRLSSRITISDMPQWMGPEAMTLEGIEQAIVGLVLLHIKLRGSQS